MITWEIEVYSQGIRRHIQKTLSLPGLLGGFWLLLVVSIGSAESPSWEDISSKIYLNFEHNATTVLHGDDYAGGIWAFDPATLDGERIRNFDTLSCQNDGYLYVGEDLQLQTVNGQLLIQTWPMEFHFEPGTWRLIGRWPTRMAGDLLSDTYEDAVSLPDVGWALQGPLLSPEDVADTGFMPGVFGIPRCVRLPLTTIQNPDWPPLGIQCSDLDTDPPGDGTSPALLWNPGTPPDPYNAELVRFLPVSAQYTGSPQISWDPDRRGLWFPSEPGDADLGFGLFPARDGQFDDPEIGVRLDLGIPSDQHFELDFFFYDSNSESLLGYGVSRSGEPNDEGEPFSFLADASAPNALVGKTSILEEPVIPNPFSSWAPKFEGFEMGPHRLRCADSDENATDAVPVSAASFRRQPDVFVQLVPIVAEATGQQHTNWSTDLWMFNPADEEILVTVRRLSNDVELPLTLGPHASIRIEEVLSWIGGGASGDGVTHDALYVTAPFHFGRQLRIDGRIWTTDPATGGTFGHALQAVPAPFGYSNHTQYVYGLSGELFNVTPPFPRTASNVVLDLRVPGRFRHNLGIVNPYNTPLEVGLLWGFDDEEFAEWRLYGPNVFSLLYPEEAKMTVVVPPKQVKIFDIQSLFPQSVSGVWPAVVSVFGKRPAPIWFSMVDQRTQDATFVPYTNYRLPALHWDNMEVIDGVPFRKYDHSNRMALPVAAHTVGLNGSVWKTDLLGFRTPNKIYPPAPIATLQIVSGGACSDGTEQYLEGVTPSDTAPWIDYCADQGWPYCSANVYEVLHPDVVRLFSGCEEATSTAGGLEIVTGSWFSGFSRTYTTRPDGGTYGSMLPLYPAGGWPIQHFAGIEVSEKTRINIGFFNGDHAHEIVHRLSLFDATGNVVAEREFVLVSLASRQMEIHDFFPDNDFPEGTYGLTVLPLDGIDDEGEPYSGHSWAYVSIVDNLTNDPTNLW